MMDVFFSSSLIEDGQIDATVVFCFEKQGLVEIAMEKNSLTEAIQRIIDLGDFQAKKGEVLSSYFCQNFQKRLVLVGLGSFDSLTIETLRRSVAKAIKHILACQVKAIQLVIPQLDPISSDELVFSIVETAFLTNYAFRGYKKTFETKILQTLALVGKEESIDIESIKALTSGVNLARDLVNQNAEDVYPKHLKDLARSFQKELDHLKVTVLDQGDLKKEEMGLFLSVAQASDKEPYFVVIEYKNAPHSQLNPVLIGKGITYDTGGLSLKPTSGMIDMKSDMGGSAVVLGVLKAVAMQKLPINVTGVCAFAENAIGSKSYKIGDVYTGKGKISVEVTNTDAEGRLALADSISYTLDKLDPSHIIDIATLTGACEIALGSERAALFSNDKSFADLLFSSGEKTSEKLWEMPLDEEYRDILKSHIADIKNSGKRGGSLIASAIFLKEFCVKDIPWAHMDIAGTTYLSEPRFYHRSKATGFGVRLLVESLRRLYQL